MVLTENSANMNAKAPVMQQLLLLFVLFLRHYSQATCKDGCNETTFFYEDIGCKPIYEKSGDCCPIKYDCSHLNNKPNDKCLLQGKLYNDRESVPNDETYGSCQIGCRCSGGSGESFTCAVLDCPEFLGQHPNPPCMSKYELNKCCSVGQICPPFDNLATCEVSGKTYYEGQRFSPNNSECQNCVCQKGFEGKFVEPFCQKTSCLVELRHSRKIQSNCAVVYISGSKCCPYTFICPSEISRTPATTKTLGGRPVCVFGREDLMIGEKFEKIEVISDYHKIETKCECRVPPLVTCVQKDVFDLKKTPEHLKPYLQK